MWLPLLTINLLKYSVMGKDNTNRNTQLNRAYQIYSTVRVTFKKIHTAQTGWRISFVFWSVYYYFGVLVTSYSTVESALRFQPDGRTVI